MSNRGIVVVGDALLDRDVDGVSERMCPDAPAPVLAEDSTVDRPGGAALAALLATDFGYPVSLVTALAPDGAGARLRELLVAAGVEVHALPMQGSTPEKIRLRASGRVLLRLDRGRGEVWGEPPVGALAALRDANAVLVSDYGGGVAGMAVVRRALPAAGLAGAAPVVWDPHPRGTAPVPGAKLATPNERELRELAGRRSPEETRLAAAASAAAALRSRWRVGAVAVTLGRDGALLCHAGPTPLVVPPPSTADGDSCGAGDRFAAAATAALAGGALVSEAVQGAVAAATEYVAAGGPRSLRDPGGIPAASPPAAAPADPATGAEAVIAAVRERGGTVVASGGCFDLLHAGHVATLQAARRLGDCLVVCLNSDASVRARKGSGRPVVPQTDRARVLAALECVDAVVVFDEETPETVLTRLQPDIWVKGGDYADGGAGLTLPEAELMRRWGGQTVVVPYLNGRSTTRLVVAARGGQQPKGSQP